MLRRYACRSNTSRGRAVKEPDSRYRTCFQRDRDRIIHSSAFRRLKYKTQVFVVDEGDYYCTRLTHSLEVAQVSRVLAEALGLEPDLAEVIALSHDLGHPPFGHIGEDVLGEKMATMGGFDHNAQAIRIVTALECHYADFDGLNLTWETLEGLAKHNGPLRGDLPYGLSDYQEWLEFDSYASGEAQVAALADDIAYNNRDLADGLRAGLFCDDDIANLALIGPAYTVVDQAWPDLDPLRRRHEALRRVFGAMVEDVIATTKANLKAYAPQNADEIRKASAPMVAFSQTMAANVEEIRQFLFQNMYRAPSVVKMRKEVGDIVAKLFDAYMVDPENLPSEWRVDIPSGADSTLWGRKVADYISGMTDRFARREFNRLIS